VTRAAPHHLVADSGVLGGLFTVRRTSGGDAWAALQDTPGSGRPAVTLGMPSIGRPQGAAWATQQDAPGPGPRAVTVGMASNEWPQGTPAAAGTCR